MKVAVVIISLMLVLAGLGCAALSSYVTPTDIDWNAVRYATSAGVTDANEYGGYPNLLKADRLKRDVDSAHSTIQLTLAQQAQKDDLEYSIHKDTVANNLALAQQREEMLFSETGLLSLGLSMAGFGTLTGFIGLMRKRPQDVTKAEMEQAVAQSQGKTAEELSAKQRQFVQLVQGIQKCINISPPSATILKTIMNETQDTDTQIAVASVKKELNL